MAGEEKPRPSFVRSVGATGGKLGRHATLGAGNLVRGAWTYLVTTGDRRKETVLGGGEILYYDVAPGGPIDGPPLAGEGGPTLEETPGGEVRTEAPRAAFRRKWRMAMLAPYAGILGTLVMLIWFPVWVAVPIAAVAHMVTLQHRPFVKKVRARLVSVFEIGVPILSFVLLGETFTAVAVFLYLWLLAVLVVLTWVVDFELMTTDGRVIRTRGLWTFERTLHCSLGDVRSAEADALTNGRGTSTVESASDRDDMLTFGVMINPSEWCNLLMYYQNVFLTARMSNRNPVDLTRDPHSYAESEVPGAASSPGE